MALVSVGAGAVGPSIEVVIHFLDRTDRAGAVR